jgi:hypothetical protein
MGISVKMDAPARFNTLASILAFMCLFSSTLLAEASAPVGEQILAESSSIVPQKPVNITANQTNSINSTQSIPVVTATKPVVTTTAPLDLDEFNKLQDLVVNVDPSKVEEPGYKSENLVNTPGKLISLLFPPKWFTTTLTEAQKAVAPDLRRQRNAAGTISYRRSLGNYEGKELSCGMGYMNDYFKDHYIGISSALYKNGQLCGLCANVWCSDSICPEALLRQKTFMIAEKCDDCIGNEIVVSLPGYIDLTGVNPDVNPSLQFVWNFTSCAPLIYGDIKLLTSPSISRKYIGLNFSNSKVPIRAARLNGVNLVLEPDGFWGIRATGEENIVLSRPYQIDLLGMNGETLRVRISALIPQSLGVNFNAGNSTD